MAENNTNIKLDALSMQIRDSVKSFAEKLVTELGKNLRSITVVDSSLTEDFKPGQKTEFGDPYSISGLLQAGGGRTSSVFRGQRAGKDRSAEGRILNTSIGSLK